MFPTRRCFVPFAILLPLGACATGTGIVSSGPNTYFLSEMRSPVRGGGEAAQQAVLAEARAFCQAQQRVAVPLQAGPDGDPYTPYYPTAFTATFQCLPSSDPKAAALEVR